MSRAPLQVLGADSMKIPQDPLEGKKVLITGVAGFIGSWMAEALCDAGALVTGIDNFSTGTENNLKGLTRRGNFRFEACDIVKGDIKSVDGGNLDYVLHLASRPSPDDYSRNQIDTLLVNSIGTSNILELARKHDSRVLFTSTSEIYGNASVIPTPETYFGYVNPTGEMSAYKESKRFGESLCVAYHRTYGIDVRIARPFNTYGPRIDPKSDYDRVIARFVKQALAGRPITVHGDGSQSRSFCYISDAVAGLVSFLVARTPEKVLNIGSDKEISILSLARLVKRVVKSSSSITFVDARKDDVQRRCPDITKAKATLEWEPAVSLSEGLRRTARWWTKQKWA